PGYPRTGAQSLRWPTTLNVHQSPGPEPGPGPRGGESRRDPKRASGRQRPADPQRDERRPRDVEPLLEDGAAGIEGEVPARERALEGGSAGGSAEPLLDAEERVGSAGEPGPPRVLPPRQHVRIGAPARVRHREPALPQTFARSDVD